MSSRLTDEQQGLLTEVVERKPGLSADDIAARYELFEEWAAAGMIKEDEPNYIKMKMVGAHLLAMRGDYHASLGALNSILDLAIRLDNKDFELRCLNNIALVKQALGQTFAAIDIWHKLLESELSLPDRALYTINLGVALNRVMKPKEAVGVYFAALEMFDEGTENQYVADIYNNLGNLHKESGNDEKAKEYFLMALDIYSKIGNNERIALVYNNLLACCNQLLDTGEGERYAALALEYYKSFLPENQLSVVLNNIAALRMIEGNLPQANHLYKDSLKIAENYHDSHLQCQVLNNLAQSANDMEDYDGALDYAWQAQSIAATLGNQSAEAISFAQIKSAWFGKSCFEKAYEAQNRELELTISINRDNNALNIAQAEARHLQNRLEQQLEAIRDQNQALADSNLIVSRKSQELETKNNFLHATNRLLNRIISIIAHDVRGPVATITRTTEIIRDSRDPKLMDEMMGHLLESSQETERLIDELLEIARKYKSGLEEEPDDFDLVAEAQAKVQLARVIAQSKHIEVQFSSNREAVIIHAAKGKLALIMRNLLSNAIKFSHPGSTISVSLKQDAEHMILQVSDGGVGMRPSQIEKIMAGASFSEPGTNQEKGFGMGLVFVLEAVIHTKAKLEIESRPGQGSTFRVIYRVSDLQPNMA